LDHLQRVKQEFTRQAGTFATAAAITDDQLNGTLDVVSSENAEESALQNAIETLRDPSHARMLAPSELLSEVEGAGFRIDTQTTWDKPRELDEWMGIINEPERAAPLRTVVGALARAGANAGMGLLQAGGEIVFFHRWLLIAARKRRT
jgi:hypothetical protein